MADMMHKTAAPTAQPAKPTQRRRAAPLVDNRQAGVVQLARVNIRKSDQTITGVSAFPSRPSSNARGGQGHHRTAYVVFEDTIVSKVRGRTLAEAAASLQGYLEEILLLPGMKSAAYLEAPLKECWKALNDPKNVNAVIDEILAIRNQVPGVAEKGKGAPNDEAGSSLILRTVDHALQDDAWNNRWDPKVVSMQCREAVWKLFAYDPPHADNDKKVQKIANHVTTFIRSIISAYPHVEAWLYGRGDTFQAYLENHRYTHGFPLQRLTKGELTAVFNVVNKNW